MSDLPILPILTDNDINSTMPEFNIAAESDANSLTNEGLNQQDTFDVIDDKITDGEKPTTDNNPSSQSIVAAELPILVPEDVIPGSVEDAAYIRALSNPQSKLQPATRYNYNLAEDFEFNYNVDDNPYELRAQAQSNSDKWANFGLRLLPGIAGKVTESFGFILGLGTAATMYGINEAETAIDGDYDGYLSDNYRDIILNNQIVQLGEFMDKGSESYLPIYERQAYEDATALQRWAYPEHLGKVGDGIEFMISAIVGGGIASTAKVGQKLAIGLTKKMLKTTAVETKTFLNSLSKAAKLKRAGKFDEAAAILQDAKQIENLTDFQLKAIKFAEQTGDFATIHAFNVTSESLFEAKGNSDEALHLYQGKINPNTGQIYSADELDAIQNQVAMDTFKFNVGVLSLTNLFETFTTGLILKNVKRTGFGRMIGKLKKSDAISPNNFNVKMGGINKMLTSGYLKTGMSLQTAIKAARLTKGAMGTTAGMSINAVNEGIFEENLQLAITNAAIENKSSWSNIWSNWYDNFSTKEGQEAMLLGAAIGFLPGGYAGYKTSVGTLNSKLHQANYNASKNGILNHAPKLFVTKVDPETGEDVVQTYDNGAPIYNSEEVANYLTRKSGGSLADIIIADAIETNDSELLAEGMKLQVMEQVLNLEMLENDSELTDNDIAALITKLVDDANSVRRAHLEISGKDTTKLKLEEKKLADGMIAFAQDAVNNYNVLKTFVKQTDLNARQQNELLNQYHTSYIHKNVYAELFKRTKTKYNEAKNIKGFDEAKYNALYAITQTEQFKEFSTVIQDDIKTSLKEAKERINEEYKLHNTENPEDKKDLITNETSEIDLNSKSLQPYLSTIFDSQMYFAAMGHSAINSLANSESVEEYKRQDTKRQNEIIEQSKENHKAAKINAINSWKKELALIGMDKEGNIINIKTNDIIDVEALKVITNKAKELDRVYGSFIKRVIGNENIPFSDLLKKRFDEIKKNKLNIVGVKKATVTDAAKKVANTILTFSSKITLNDEGTEYNFAYKPNELMPLRRQSNFAKHSSKDANENVVELEKDRTERNVAPENEFTLLRGNAIDFIGKNVLHTGNLTVTDVRASEYGSIFKTDEDIQAFIDYFLEIRKKILPKNGTILIDVNVGTLNHGNGVGGEIDVLTIDANGNIIIYDIKSVKDESLKDIKRWKNQLSIYKVILENTTNVKVIDGKILAVTLNEYLDNENTFISLEDKNNDTDILTADIANAHKEQLYISQDPKDNAKDESSEDNTSPEEVYNQYGFKNVDLGTTYLSIIRARQEGLIKVLHSDFKTKLINLQKTNETSTEQSLTISEEMMNEFIKQIIAITNQQLYIHNTTETSEILELLEKLKSTPNFKSSYNLYFNALFNTMEEIAVKVEQGQTIDEGEQNLNNIHTNIMSFINNTFTDTNQEIVYNEIKLFLSNVETRITDMSANVNKIRPSIILYLNIRHNKGLEIFDAQLNKLSTSEQAKYKDIGAVIREKGIMEYSKSKKHFDSIEQLAITVAITEELYKVDVTKFASSEEYVEALINIIKGYRTVLANNLYQEEFSLIEDYFNNFTDQLTSIINDKLTSKQDNPNAADLIKDFNDDGGNKITGFNIWLHLLDNDFKKNGVPMYTKNDDDSITFNNDEGAAIYELLPTIKIGDTVTIEGSMVRVKPAGSNDFITIGRLNNADYLKTEYALLKTLTENETNPDMTNILALVDSINNSSATTEETYIKLYNAVMLLMNDNSATFFSTTGDKGQSLFSDIDKQSTPKDILMLNTNNFKDSIRGGEYLAKVLQRGKVNPHYTNSYANDIEFHDDLMNGKIANITIAHTSAGSIENLTKDGLQTTIPVTDVISSEDLLSSTNRSFIGISEVGTTQINDITGKLGSLNNIGSDAFVQQSLFLVMPGLNNRLTPIGIRRRHLTSTDSKAIEKHITEIHNAIKSGSKASDITAIVDKINYYIYYSDEVTKTGVPTGLTYDITTNILTIDMNKGLVNISFSPTNIDYSYSDRNEAGYYTAHGEQNETNFSTFLESIVTSGSKNINFNRINTEGLPYLQSLLDNKDIEISMANVKDKNNNVIGHFQPEGHRPYTIRLKEDTGIVASGEKSNDAEIDIAKEDDTTDSGISFDEAFEDNSIFSDTFIASSEEFASTIDRITATDWLKEKLGNSVNLQWFSEYIYARGTTSIIQGQVDQNIIKLADYAVHGTEYHEAFHYVFNNLLSTKEKADILNEAMTVYNLTDETAAMEQLAEDYRAWEINKQGKQSLPAKLIKFFKDFFARVLFIKNNTVLIKDFFDNISNGEYRVTDNKEGKLELTTLPYSIPGFTVAERTSASSLMTQIAVGLQVSNVNVFMGMKNSNGTLMPPQYKRYNQITVRDIKENSKLDLKVRVMNKLNIYGRKFNEEYKAATNKDVKEQLLKNMQFIMKMINDIKNNNDSQSLIKDMYADLNKYHNIKAITYDDIVKMETEESYKLTKMFSDNAFKESAERNFKAITKHIIASGIEYGYDKEGNPIQIIDKHTGLPKPINYELVYPKLQSLLKDIPNATIMHERMVQIAEFFPTIQQYIDKVFIVEKTDDNAVNEVLIPVFKKNENGELTKTGYKKIKLADNEYSKRNAWFTDFNKTTVNEVAVVVPREDIKSPTNSIKILNKDYHELLLNNFRSEIVNRNALNVYDNVSFTGKTLELTNRLNSKLHAIVSTDASIKSSYKNLTSKAEVNYIINLLIEYAKHIGLNDIDRNSIIGYLNESTEYFAIGGTMSTTPITNKLGNLKNLLSLSIPTEIKILNHQSLGKLANIVDRYSLGKLNFSYRDLNKNTKYGISKHNGITIFLAKIKTNPVEAVKYLTKLATLPEFKHSNLLQIGGTMSLLTTNSKGATVLNLENANMFNLNLYGGLTQEYNDKVEDFLTQDDISWIYTKQALYASNTSIESGNLIRTILPIFGDSDNHYVLSRRRLPLVDTDIKFETDGTVSLNATSALYKAIHNTVKNEIGRIEQDARILFKNGVLRPTDELDELKLIEDRHYIVDNNNKRVYVDPQGNLTGSTFTFSNVDVIDFDTYFSNGNLDTQMLEADMHGLINNWINNRLLSTNKDLYTELKDKFKYTVSGREELVSTPYYDQTNSDNAYELLTIEQILNSYLNNVETQLFFSGTNYTQSTYEKVTKRAKKAIQFGEQGAITGTYSNLVLNDKFVGQQEFVDLYKGWLSAQNTSTERMENILNDYSGKIEASDGWSLMSLKHWVKVMKHFGKWDDVQHLIEFKDGKYSIKKGLTLNELTNLIQVLKPIHVENKINVVRIDGIEYKMMNYIYHKTSTFIPTELFAETNSDLNNMRIFMEDNNIDNVIFKSGRKDGNIFVEDIFDENNNMDLTRVNLSHVENLNMANYSLQLHVPDDIRDEKIKVGIQFYKHIIGNINDEHIYSVPQGLFNNSDTITGKELKEIHMDAFVAIIVNDANKLYENLGAITNKTDVEELPLLTHDKFYSTFVNEAKSRNYSNNDIESVTFNDLEYTLNENDVDILSIVLGNVTTNKGMQLTNDFSFGTNSGRSKALFSSLFANGITNTKFSGGHVVLLSEAVSSVAKKLTDDNTEYSSDLKVFKENGIIYVEAIMPAWSKDFIDVDGNPMDINNIDPKVLNMIGYRVPISSKHSSVVIRVKNFSPPTSGSVVTLPSVLITQTGWDFDVDSLFIMTKQHKVTKNGIKVVEYKDITYAEFVANRIKEIGISTPKLNDLIADRSDLQNYIQKAYESIFKNKAVNKAAPDNVKDGIKARIEISDLEKRLESEVDQNKIAAIEERITNLTYSFIEDDGFVKAVGKYYGNNAENQILLSEIKQDIIAINSINEEIKQYLFDNNLLLTKAEFKVAKDKNIHNVLSGYQLQNKLIDVWSYLLSQHNGLEERLASATFNSNIVERDRINALISEQIGHDISIYLNPTNPEDQVQIHNDIIGGKAMLSIAANMDAVTTILENTKAELANGIVIEYDNVGKANELYSSDNITGNLINHSQLGWTLDSSNTNIDGKLIIENIAEDVDHTVDSATAKMIRNVNITTFPSNIIMKAVGISNDYIANLFNQYAINRMLYYKNNINRITKYADRPETLALREMYTDILRLKGSKFKTEKTSMEHLKELVEKTGVSFDTGVHGKKNSLLEEMLSLQYQYFPEKLHVDSHVETHDVAAEEKIKFLITQINVLEFYNSIAATASSSSRELSFLNADKIHSGTTFERLADLINAVEKPQLDEKGKIVPPSIVVNGKGILTAVYKEDAYRLLRAYYEKGVVVPFNTLRKFYSTQSDNVRDTLIEPFKNEFKKYNRNFDKDLYEFENYIMFNFLSDFHIFDKSTTDLLSIGGFKVNPTKTSIHSLLLEYKDLADVKRPAFIDVITSKTYAKSGNAIFLKLKDTVSRDYIDVFQKSVMQTWENGGKDKQLVESLLIYSYLTENLGYGANNISSLFSQELYAKMGLTSVNNSTGYTYDVLQKSQSSTLTLSYNETVDNFILDHSDSNRYINLVPMKARTNGKTVINWGEKMLATSKDTSTNTFSVSAENFDLESDSITSSRFIKVRVKVEKSYAYLIFKKIEHTGNDVVFQQVDMSNRNKYVNKPVNERIFINNGSINDMADDIDPTSSEHFTGTDTNFDASTYGLDNTNLHEEDTNDKPPC